MSGFGARMMGNGAVNQASVQMTQDVPEILQDLVLMQPVRVLVLAVYYPEEDDRTEGKWATTVDVRTVGSRHRYLYRVPVCELAAGLYDEDIRIPRPASVNADSSAAVLVAEPSAGSKPTEASATDGDILFLFFENADPRRPFCMPFGPPHPKRTNFPAKSEGRVRRIRHNGTVIEIDANGNVLIDASNAKTDALSADGSQVDNPSGGNVEIKTRGLPGVLSLQEATDAVAKGDALSAALNTLLNVIGTWANTASGGAPITAGAPVKTAIDNFMADTSWLSTRVKTG